MPLEPTRGPSARDHRVCRGDGTRAGACRWNRPACLGVRPHGPPARPPISRARGDAAATRPGPAAKGERGTGFPRAAAGPPLHRQRSQIRLCRSAPLPRDFGPGRSAAASTLGRCCAARWASPSAPAGRWPRADCGNDPHPRGLMASVGTTGAARDKTDQDLTYPQGGVGSRVVGSTCGRRQAASCARLCSRYGGGGKGSLDPTGGNRRAAGAPCA